MLLEIHVYRTVNSPIRTYGALLVVVAVAASGAVILSGFVAIDFVLGTVTVRGYMATVDVVIVRAVVDWPTDLPRIPSNEFGSEGQ